LPAWLLACSVEVSASDISLTARISDESLQVTSGAFSELQGSFQLELVLGSEAPGSTQVSLGKFELHSESGELLADLGDATPEPMFPFDLDKGESQRVLFTIDGIGVDRESVCKGPVRIVGSVSDALKGASVPVQGGLVMPNCG
jgi:hypothetical protein